MPPTVIIPMRHLREADRTRNTANLIPPTILTRIKRNRHRTEVIITTATIIMPALADVARSTTQTRTLVGRLKQLMPIITTVIRKTEHLKGTLVKVILGNIQMGHLTITSNSSSLSHNLRTILVANRYRDTTLAIAMLVHIPTPMGIINTDS